MKIAVTSMGRDLSSPMDLRFGRAACFIVVDSETMEFEVVENTQNLNAPQGAGIQAGKTIINSGASVIITGNCGPKAFRVLTQGNVKIVTGTSGSVADALAQFKNNELAYADQANVEGHWI